jgi:ubiquinone/menaquinone biosynthesis C-methylase UbiE
MRAGRRATTPTGRQQMSGSGVANEAEHKARVREQFGTGAKDYVASTYHRTGNDLARVAELIEGTPDAVALDVATGGGHTALAIAPHVKQVVASDLTPAMLTAAEEFITGQGVTNVTFEVAEAERLPFPDASFDIVTCRVAPHHFADVHAFTREVVRVLKPGGRFVLIDTFAPEDDELDAFFNDVEVRRDPTHVRDYRISEWRDWLTQLGLDVDTLERFDKAHEFDDWTARSRMSAADKASLEHDILTAPARVREYFEVVEDNGHLVSFADQKFLLRARKVG